MIVIIITTSISIIINITSRRDNRMSDEGGPGANSPVRTKRLRVPPLLDRGDA